MPATPYQGAPWVLAKAPYRVIQPLLRGREDTRGEGICGTCLALAGQQARQRPPDISQLSQNGWVLSHNGDALCAQKPQC